MGILFRRVTRQKRGQVFNDVVSRKRKISPQLRLSPRTDAVDVFSHAGFIELEKISWTHSKEATVSCGREEDLRYLNFSIESVIESEIKQWVHETGSKRSLMHNRKKQT